MHATFLRRLLTCVGLVVLCGCGQHAAVLSGNVTYDDQPVEGGSIAFLPADGLGPVCGGPIEQGKYRVEVVSPGKKVVQITALKKFTSPRSREELVKTTSDKSAKASAAKVVERADAVPADAQGNNVVVDIAERTQTMDFRLSRPAGKADPR